jgi:3-hydroxyacyl-[acyl-carrier-protein] dehydratase
MIQYQKLKSGMLNRTDVLKRLPQGEPFVFIDAATVIDGEATGSYTFTGQECFAAGHFPNRPILPASIMVEALGQLGIVYMMEPDGSSVIDPESIFFIKSEDVACRRKCLPGDRLEMRMKVLRSREPLIQFTGEIRVGGELTLKVSSMTLSFSIQSQV